LTALIVILKHQIIPSVPFPFNLNLDTSVKNSDGNYEEILKTPIRESADPLLLIDHKSAGNFALCSEQVKS
jgi:hypothetical protein